MKLAVLGYPVKHSLSPAMHNAALQEMGIEGEYIAIETKPEALEAQLNKMASEGYTGTNLTIPHKQLAFALLDNLDDSARLPGSANTIHFSATGLKGYSTDGYGLEQAIYNAFEINSLAGKKVFMAGIGGAGRAAAMHCAALGAQVTIANRSIEKAMTLAQEIKGTMAVSDFHHFETIKEHDIIINATSVGMKPEDPPLFPQEAFREGQRVMDMIYVNQVTPFMRPAIAAGAKAINGLDMLLYQGVRSLEIWTGMEVPVKTMRNALNKAANLV